MLQFLFLLLIMFRLIIEGIEQQVATIILHTYFFYNGIKYD